MGRKTRKGRGKKPEEELSVVKLHISGNVLIKNPELFLKVRPTENAESLQAIMKGVVKFSRYSWVLWLIIKVFVKISSMYLPKDKNMRAEDHFWITEQWMALINWLINLETEKINNVVCIIVSIGDIVSYHCKATILGIKESEEANTGKNKNEEKKCQKEEKIRRKNSEARLVFHPCQCKYLLNIHRMQSVSLNILIMLI